MMKPFRLRWSLLGQLLLIAIVAAMMGWRSLAYRRQILLARDIRSAGGDVMYGWHAIHVMDSTWHASMTRQRTLPSGKTVTVPWPYPVPYRLVHSDHNRSGNDPEWSVLGSKENWEIQYVEIPIEELDQQMVSRLRSLPQLRYLQVAFKQQSEGYFMPSEGQAQELREIRNVFPGVEIINIYSHFVDKESFDD